MIWQENIELQRIENLIKKRTGLCVQDDLKPQFCDEVRAAMKEKRACSAGEYHAIILNDRDEFQRIVNFITNNETYFFREPAHYKLISQKLIPEIYKRKGPGGKIRIISAGCSTGEEPYSLVITLMEKYGDRIGHLFSVQGFDLDDRAIKTAGDGIYQKASFRNMDETIKRRYFVNAGANGFKLRKDVRQMVDFHKANLGDMGHFNIMGKADIIMYRNVSIYFEPSMRIKVFNSLCDILRDKGYLIVGATETLTHKNNGLPLVEMDGVFLFQKNPHEHNVPDGSWLIPPKKRKDNGISSIKASHDVLFPPAEAALHIPAPDKKDEAPQRDDFHELLYKRARELVEKKEYMDAIKLLDSMIEQGSLITKCRALKAGILINLKDTERAKKICLSILEENPLCMEGHLLLGIMARAESDFPEAKKRLKKTIYLKSSNWLAHFYLGEIYRNTGDGGLAKREYAIVANLLEKGGFSEHGLDIFPLSFSENDIVRLCRQYI